MTFLRITRGDDETLNVLVKDRDTGLPIDLEGAELWWMVKALEDDEDIDALVTKTSVDGIEIAPDQDTDTGEATVTVNAADTEGVEPGIWFWELQGLLGVPEATLKTLASGRIRISRDLIRATGLGS